MNSNELKLVTGGKARFRLTGYLLRPLLPLLFLSIGCLNVHTDPIEVKPIHITMDVNVKIDRQLDEFFAFEDKLDNPKPTTTTQAVTVPTTAGGAQ